MREPYDFAITLRSCSKMLGAVSVVACIVAVTAEFMPGVLDQGVVGLPIVNAITVVAAAVIAWLLAERARVEHDPRLAWLATGYTVAAVAMTAHLIGFPTYDGGGPLNTSSDGVLGLYLFLHLSLAVTALVALSSHAASDRIRRGVLVAGVAVASYLSVGGLPLPDLVNDEGVFTTPALVGHGVVTVLTALATFRLWQGRIRTPLWAQPLITASFGCSTWELIFHSFAGERFSPLWWAAVVMKLCEFLILGGGLMMGVLALTRSLERFTDDLLQRLAGAEPEGEAPVVPEEINRRSAAPSMPIATVVDLREVEPVYQPVVDLATGRTVGVEALSRFPSRPGVSPAVVFAQAAREGMSASLELMVVDLVLERLPDLDPDTWVAINLSPMTLGASALGDRLLRIDASRVVLEITEHVPVSEYDALSAALRRLRALGTRVAVDDAGAGFASFRHVVRLRPDIIKLDISLTTGIDRDPVRRALAASIITFAASVGSTVVAEGIETAREQAALTELGVPLGQGYYLGRPGLLPTAAGVG